MKKKQLLVSLSLAMTVLFSILIQSVHTYSHFVEQWAKTECHHKYNVTHTEITHQHHAFEQCTVCHFSLGSYVTSVAFKYKFASNYKLIPHISFSFEEVILFSGSLYSHRGPPSSVSSII